MYKKENVYLAEAAQILQRLVQYELPVMKRQIAKAEQGVDVRSSLLYVPRRVHER